MPGKLNYEQIAEMAQEMKILLENHLLEDPEIAAPFIEHAQSISKEIEKMGLLVQRKASFDTQTLQISVQVEVLKPKENMTMGEQNLYDEWLLKKAGINSKIEN